MSVHTLLLILNSVMAAVLAVLLFCVPAATGGEVRSTLGERLSLPISEWRSTTAPRAYLIAIHGLSLHGQVYSRLGQQLSAGGITVIAPDLRGYGESDEWAKSKSRIDYAGSLEDLVRITDELHREQPDVPVYVLGESLGASMAIQLSAQRPEGVDGLILSAPGVKVHRCMPLKMLPAVLHMLVDRKHHLDLRAYLRDHFSNDRFIVSEHLSNKTVRTKFSIRAIFSTCSIVRRTLKMARLVPANVPVLILQGQNDKMLEPVGAQRLRVSFARHDAALIALPAAGHILLETSQPNPVAVRAVDSWLSKQIRRSSYVAQAPDFNQTLNANGEL